ncbi:cytochrome P450 [Aurantimonas sp. A2-1-M11]|uniref:cytochrome P450 n=1 Tax=Aurantimonas sp. A2-1-M11 TaxID=3113712 RepID=UPI002F94F86A
MNPTPDSFVPVNPLGPARLTSPPGPKGLPVLGSLLDLGSDVLGFFPKCAERYGDVVAFRLGAWPALLLSNPDDVEYVFVDAHENFVKNRFFWRQVTAIFGKGIMTNEGEDWLRHRRIAAPAFATRRVNDYADTMVQLTSEMLDTWTPGDVRDAHAEMMSLTLRIAAKTLFDASVEEDVAAMDHALNDITSEITARFSRPFVIPDAVPLPGHVRYNRALRRIETIVTRIIAERQQNPGDRGDFLSALMKASYANGQPLPDKQLRDEAVTMLLAGHETTALALSWTLYLLGQHSEIDVRLSAEVHAVLGSRPPAVEDLAKLTNTGEVITEAMRLYPPAWLIGRETVKDCVIGGYHVPAGTTVFVSPWILHRDPRVFDDPLSFRPGRWTPEFTRQLPRFAYMPFGGGPRICIGKSFALMEASLILAALVQRYRFEWSGDRPIAPSPSITLRPKGGVPVRLHERQLL